MGSVIIIRGVTDNSSTSGDCTLNSDILQATATSIRIPYGQKLRIWARRAQVVGQATDFLIQWAKDGSTYRELDRIKLAANTQDNTPLEARKPTVLRTFSGVETMKVTWSQSVAGLAYVELVIEFVDMSEEDNPE